jgi:hypothetical protein
MLTRWTIYGSAEARGGARTRWFGVILTALAVFFLSPRFCAAGECGAVKAAGAAGVAQKTPGMPVSPHDCLAGAEEECPDPERLFADGRIDAPPPRPLQKRGPRPPGTAGAPPSVTPRVMILRC